MHKISSNFKVSNTLLIVSKNFTILYLRTIQNRKSYSQSNSSNQNFQKTQNINKFFNNENTITKNNENDNIKPINNTISNPINNPTQMLVLSFRRKGLLFSIVFIIPFLAYIIYDYYVNIYLHSKNTIWKNISEIDNSLNRLNTSEDEYSNKDQTIQMNWKILELELLRDDLPKLKRYFKKEFKEWKEVNALLKYIASLSGAQSIKSIQSQHSQTFESTMSLNNESFFLLRDFLEDEDEKIKISRYKTINFIRLLAMESDEHISKDKIKFLTSENQYITLTKLDVACLLAKAFFGLYTGRIDFHTYYDYKYKIVPSINMFQLFTYDNVNDKNILRIKKEKLKFLFQYFETLRQRVEEDGSLDLINYIPQPRSWYQFWKNNRFNQISQIQLYRNCLDSKTSVDYIFDKELINATKDNNKPMNKLNSLNPLQPTNIIMKNQITIEEDRDCILSDFSNRFLGGGVFNVGCTQEEIIFFIYPELLVTRLLCPRLDWNESITIKGVERFSNYKGFASTFSFDGPHHDKYIIDGQATSTIIAFDPLKFKYNNITEQWKKNKINREILKSYIAFKNNPLTNDFDKISTGNWGFGSYYGDPELKFIIQWISATLAGKKLSYHFELHSTLEKKIKKFIKFVQKNEISVFQIYKALTILSDEYSIQNELNTRYPDTLQEVTEIIKNAITTE